MLFFVKYYKILTHLSIDMSHLFKNHMKNESNN